MPNIKLFGNKIPPACKYCAKGLKTFENDTVLCAKRGVVQADYHCRYYFYDPLKRVPKRPLPLQKFEASDFSVE